MAFSFGFFGVNWLEKPSRILQTMLAREQGGAFLFNFHLFNNSFLPCLLLNGFKGVFHAFDYFHSVTYHVDTFVNIILNLANIGAIKVRIGEAREDIHLEGVCSTQNFGGEDQYGMNN
jgi:hypothetical protein